MFKPWQMHLYLCLALRLKNYRELGRLTFPTAEDRRRLKLLLRNTKEVEEWFAAWQVWHANEFRRLYAVVEEVQPQRRHRRRLLWLRVKEAYAAHHRLAGAIEDVVSLLRCGKSPDTVDRFYRYW